MKERENAGFLDSGSGGKRSILIVCTGNSCRSQMAEAIWNRVGGNDWIAKSAGSAPSGYVHPLALEAMAEIGLSTDGLTSKSIEPFQDQTIDLVITVCDNARDACPVLPGAKKTLHWPFDDPADAIGTDDQKMESFRRIRDEIQHQISAYLEPEQTSN